MQKDVETALCSPLGELPFVSCTQVNLITVPHSKPQAETAPSLTLKGCGQCLLMGLQMETELALRPLQPPLTARQELAGVY